MTQAKIEKKRPSLFRQALGCAILFALVWAITADLGLAALVGLLDAAVKLGWFFLFPGESSPVPGPPAVLWFTGLSGAGKTTIARKVFDRLRQRQNRVEWLDGDVTREFIPQTGFSKEDRDKHVLNAGFIARLLEHNGVTVVASYISPYAETREKVRAMCTRFVEVYIATPLEECERRDAKGLYARARRGEIENFTGIDDPYEPPSNPEIEIDTRHFTIEQACAKIIAYLDGTVS